MGLEPLSPVGPVILATGDGWHAERHDGRIFLTIDRKNTAATFSAEWDAADDSEQTRYGVQSSLLSEALSRIEKRRVRDAFIFLECVPL